MRRAPRLLSVLVALLVVALAPSSGSARTPKATQMVQLQTALLGQINGFRLAHGLSRLTSTDALTNVASGHSAQMARLGYFSHNSANGQSFSQRLAQVY